MTPTTKPIQYTSLAAQELLEQIAWYDVQADDGRADHFLSVVKQTEQHIQQNPALGMSYDGKGSRKRRLPKPYTDFALYFREQDERILIVAVWRGQRNPAR